MKGINFMDGNLGGIIYKYRQAKNLTQEEFALRLGVTPQAVSKWERGKGIPDISLISGICSILGISADILLGIKSTIVENSSINAEIAIKNNMAAEPLVLEFGEDKKLFTRQTDNIDNNSYKEIVLQITKACKDNYCTIINKHIVELMINNIKENFPGIADGLVPEKISYLQVERKLQEIIKNGGTIRDLIHILEEMEENIN